MQVSEALFYVDWDIFQLYTEHIMCVIIEEECFMDNYTDEQAVL